MEKLDQSLSLKDSRTCPPSTTVAEIEPVASDKALIRKIDWRIVPIMFLVYFLQFLDKVTLNVSKEQRKHASMMPIELHWIC